MPISSRRGGILLDAVLAVLVLSLTGYALDRIGITFSQLVAGIHQFLGV